MQGLHIPRPEPKSAAMTASPPPNPADLRMILGDNLRKLCGDVASISELCRVIGVNRTQFNRYLSGTAFPRPDTLFRICRHFGVDANILLRPLDEVQAAASSALETTFTPLSLSGLQRPFDHYMLPDGMYRYWRKSFRQPNRAYQGMAQVRTFGEIKMWKGYDIHDAPTRTGTRRFSRSTSYNGILIQQFDGFALMSRTPYNDLMNVTFFEYGMDALPDYYSGLSFVTRRRLPEANRLTAIVMQRLPSDCSAWLSWARQCGSHPLDSVPSEILGALNRIPDRI
jgi:transcriptional regulator with XRE-family HTH domain